MAAPDTDAGVLASWSVTNPAASGNALRAGRIARLLHRLAAIACLAVVALSILSDDTVRAFPTIAHRLGRVLFENWWKLLPVEHDVGWLQINTVEALLLVTALATIGWMWVDGRRPVVTAEVVVVAGFIGLVALMFTVGVSSGGALKPALWQVRPYFHIAAITLLLTQIIRNDADLRRILFVMSGAIVLKAALTVWVFFALADTHFSGWRELVGHEDSVFFGAIFFFLLALALYEDGSRMKAVVLVIGSLLVAALVLNLRRAGYAAFGMSALLLPLVLVGRRRLASGLLVVAVAVGALYLTLFWTNEGPLGVPAQKVRSVIAAGDTSDYSSNIYRSGENLNLWATVQEHPLGIGFGKPFEKPFPVADLSAILPNWDYHPHNAVFGLWMALGTPAFVVVMWLFAVPIASASLTMRRSGDAFTRAASLFCLVGLSGALLVSNLDQFIWAQRGALFVGALLGIASAIGALQSRDRETAAKMR
jgi:hypothetical protein